MNRTIDLLMNNLNYSEKNAFWIRFCRNGLYLFLIVKIVFIQPILEDVTQFIPVQFTGLSSVLFAPILLAEINIFFFIIPFLIVLLVGIIFRHTYYNSFIILWFSICLSRLTLQIINGSDLVLNLLLLCSIFMEVPPAYRKFSNLHVFETIAGAARILCQIQVVFIYFQSGYNKLLSEAWRSGDAIYSITHLTFFQNPNLPWELNETECLLLAWGVILFEIGFALLIWVKRLRLTLLVLGCIFHISIILFLGLLDFGLIMIIGYCVFLPIQRSKPLSVSLG
ncbi:MAG: hypothetical protein JNM78_19015 [Cyclobacteriaceae bacterium]|nr:hypothetical protein [Cyclobacteriaceae bacterium]